MSGYVDRENTRADYTLIHGLKTDENGVVYTGPSLYSLNSTIKNFEYVTTVCPECSTEEHSVACWIDEIGDDVCPECGLLCSTKAPLSHGDPKFLDTRGEHNPSGPSLADPPVPDENSDPELYSLGDAHL